MVTLSKELKEAIAELPSKEKDKLLFRLIRKDHKLVHKLHFELVDNNTVDENRAIVAANIQSQISHCAERYYSPGYLMMDLRDVSGQISYHVGITKDKFGEVSLNLLMLNQVLPLTIDKVSKASLGKSHKFCVYVIARAFKILLLINSLHEDYKIDFKDDVNQLGKHIGNSPLLMKSAMHHGLDVNWLLRFDIPEDIVGYHKELRANGYLK